MQSRTQKISRNYRRIAPKRNILKIQFTEKVKKVNLANNLALVTWMVLLMIWVGLLFSSGGELIKPSLPAIVIITFIVSMKIIDRETYN